MAEAAAAAGGGGGCGRTCCTSIRSSSATPRLPRGCGPEELMPEKLAIRAVSAEGHYWSGELAKRMADADLRERKGHKLFSGFGPKTGKVRDHC